MSQERLKNKVFLGIQYWAIPLLLILVASRQMILAHTVGLSPWHGGGFGMFASIDRDERRIIRLQSTDCRGQQTVHVLTPELAEIDEQTWTYLTTVPKTSLLQSLGYQLLTLAGEPTSRVSTVSSTCPRHLEIQVWRLHYNQASGQVWYAPVTAVVEVTL